jgi:D-alanyl-D-alanine carboxypeptidase
MKQLLTLTAAFFMVLNVSAQTFDKAKLDSFFSLLEKNNKGMGSISIFKEGKEVYTKSIGYADVEHGLKADNETVYRIGSISKTFTATMIMQLVESGKLTLEDKLSKFYPDVPNAEKITIEHLLRHRSGIFNFTNAEDYEKWMLESFSREQLLEKVKSYESAFEPNAKASYSNSNYVLLSMIIEKIEGKSFNELLKSKITKNNRLIKTYQGGTINYKGNEALSYTKLKNWDKMPETDMSIPLGAGAVVSTPTDLNTFLTALFNNKIVEEKQVEQMKKMVDGFGIGLFQFPFNGKAAFGHTGGIDGFQSMAGYFPKEKVSIAYISNGVVMPVNDIMIAALSIYFGEKYELPVFEPAFEVKAEDLDQYLGVYSTPAFPLKLTITKKEGILMAQGTGQPSFPLEASGEHKFKFDAAQLKLTFLPKENKMVLEQGGAKFEMTKE